MIESIEEEFGYSTDTDTIREHKYPLLNGTTYLDHAGTTLYAKSFIELFSDDMISSLFGNPYSMSVLSRLSIERIEDFFNASPDEFDMVFVANATVAIKLIGESFRDDPRGFWYRYHVDAYTSVWCGQIRSAANEGRNVFTLLNAASFLLTAPLDLSDVATAPDFTALSFYKIFGFPDLGALVVRKSTVSVLKRRKFFGGGTVDMHTKKETSIHERLKDSTLLFHSIIALDTALKTHKRLIIAFNIRNSHGEWIPKSEEGEELRRYYATSLRCGDDYDILDSRLTSILRVSLGAISNLKDIDSLTEFVEEFYIEKVPPLVLLSPPIDASNTIAP
ncbi:hypothetical protein N7499_012057 [Penicillium canescens]|nr:hypothetical protein N7499_012057 [Penicillium canescens]